MLPLPGHPSLTKDLRSLKGVGPQLERILQEKGFQTVGDLLSLMPNRYQDRRALTPLDRLRADSEALINGQIEDLRPKRSGRTGRRFFEIIISDDTGQVTAFWFRLPAYLRRTMKKGDRVLLFGQVKDYQNRLYILHPEIIPWQGKEPPIPEIRPVYPELEDIKPGVLRRIMAQASRELSGVPAIFPQAWLKKQNLSDPITSLMTIHRPPARKTGPLPRSDQSRAWRSLSLFELIFIQLALARTRARLNREQGLTFPIQSRLGNQFLSSQPFKLTPSQAQVLKEIQQDMAAPRPMNRLLQGEVGSGKTVLAMTAALAAIDGGFQAAFMVPTEILAQQHYQTLTPYATRLGLTIDLLVGSRTEAEKNLCQEHLASGKIQLVFGTHALFSKAVQFKSLGLVVIDEQHRFGVAQRLALKSKAARPDLLVMTATPIPRSLALTLYGDLDLSMIQGLPPGRQPVKTKIFSSQNRVEAYQNLAQEVLNDGQAFVVAPRIEAKETETNVSEDLSAAKDLFRFISQEVLPQVEVGLVHGRMKIQEQQAALEAFRKGRIRVLVATTVIEVGLDVADATMILIEGADRFGLAQLHQLRGRVGRGPRPARCILISGSEDSPSESRLQIMARTSNGFILAEEDLKFRGPGDAAGLKQSGMPSLTWARLPHDLPLLLQARKLAQEIIASDPELDDPNFRLVRDVVNQIDRKMQGELVEAG
ncbi:MAG: ATP-dependent DNA helicase RecG [Deltaproteobacteria bacterium]|nr:ATP-dependent DNA helicase RecG [Deltaproteobacteria bacterium]MBW2084778.1 ATP-dependent DNA helicase RecG [Deltaproteobacteria bacterium]